MDQDNCGRVIDLDTKLKGASYSAMKIDKMTNRIYEYLASELRSQLNEAKEITYEGEQKKKLNCTYKRFVEKDFAGDYRVHLTGGGCLC